MFHLLSASVSLLKNREPILIRKCEFHSVGLMEAESGVLGGGMECVGLRRLWYQCPVCFPRKSRGD